jgi:hypothetical protein
VASNLWIDRMRRSREIPGGQPIVLFWYAHEDGDAVRAVARAQVEGDRLAGFRNYFFTPDVIAEICGELDVPFRVNGYRYWWRHVQEGSAMRKLILSMMVSLDGSIARGDGDIEWFLTDERLEEVMLGLLRSVDAMMFGRVSYQLLAEYWPKAGTFESPDAPGGFTSDERRIEFARLMNEIPQDRLLADAFRSGLGPGAGHQRGGGDGAPAEAPGGRSAPLRSRAAPVRGGPGGTLTRIQTGRYPGLRPIVGGAPCHFA